MRVIEQKVPHKQWGVRNHVIGNTAQYGHFGVKLVNKRDFGDDRYGYGMFCEN